jgi:hypothetical protein
MIDEMLMAHRSSGLPLALFSNEQCNNAATSFRQGERLMMSDIARNIGGIKVLVCSSERPQISRARDANASVSVTWEHSASLVAIPAARLSADVFQPSTRLAGGAAEV